MNHVDSTSPINTVEWFFGYGGNHLGLKRCLPNLRLVAACEIEEFAIENILAKMESGLLEKAPIWSDCKTFPWESFKDRVDLFVASYPCQPFSAAGKRGGTEDPRHLWPYVLNWILRARPLCVFAENVEGHVSLGLSTVISDLEEAGYRVEAGIFSASEIGAPHQRKRVFIMAHRDSNGSPTRIPRQNQRHEGSTGIADNGGVQVWPSRPGQTQYEWEPPRVVGNTKHNGLHGTSSNRGNETDAGSWSAEESEMEQQCEGASGLGSEVRSSMGNTAEHGCQGSRGQDDSGGQCFGSTKSDGGGGHRHLEQEQRQAEPSMGGDPNGTPRGVGHAELRGPNHSAGGGKSESGGGQLDDTRGTELHGVSDRQAGESMAPTWESSGSSKLAHSIHNGCDNSHKGSTNYGEQGALGEATETEARRDWVHSTQHGQAIGDDSLYVTCDNRTDELRLLGNGVVPSTAELAFRTLWEELTNE